MKKFYLFLTLVLLALPLAVHAVELPAGRVYCYPYNVPSGQSSVNFPLATVYSFDPTASGLDWQRFSSQFPGVTNVEAATWADGKLVALRYNYGCYMYVIGQDEGGNWSYTNKTITGNGGQSATDLATHPKTQEVYGWFWASRSFYDYRFFLGRLDVASGTVTKIGADTNTFVSGLSFDDKGTLWGITRNGQLVNVALADGSVSNVGAEIGTLNYSLTDFKPQSMCYDVASGTMLYAHISESGLWSNSSALYGIDLSSQTADWKCDLGGAALAGLCVPASYDAAAPGEVAGLTAENDGVSDGISVSFAMPTHTFGGTALTSARYNVLLDGEATAHKGVSAAAGTEVTVTLTATPGTHTVEVYCSNLVGDGPKANTTVFVGADTPAAPRDVELSIAGRGVTLGWQAPLGKNGGKYDASKLTYSIARTGTEGYVATGLTETAYTEQLPAGPVVAYTYTVTAVYGGTEGETAVSNTAFGGDAFEVAPGMAFSEDFEDAADVNSTGVNVVCNGSPTVSLKSGDSGNHYVEVVGNYSTLRICMPAVLLKEKHTYRFAFDWMVPTYPYTYGFSFGFGLARTPEISAEVAEVVPSNTAHGTGVTINSFNENTRLSGEFTVPETGIYFPLVNFPGYLAQTFCIDNFTVEDISAAGTPLAITGMAAENVTPHSRSINVRFTLPTHDTSDAPAAVNKVELKRNGETLYTWTEGLSDGMSIEYLDEEAPLGDVSYAAIAYNAQGASAPAMASVRSGFDYDLALVKADAPESVTIGDNFVVKATVKNNGIMATAESEMYTVTLIEVLPDDTELVNYVEGTRLEGDQTAEFTLNVGTSGKASGVHNYRLVVDYPDPYIEQNRGNNELYPISVVFSEPEGNRPNTFEEGFEGRDTGYDHIYKGENNYIPEGWTEISKANPVNLPYPDDPTDFTWTTIPSNAYMGITPFGACYARVAGHYGATPEPSDEWLITPSITPRGGDLLQFHLAYNPYFTVKTDAEGNPVGYVSRLEVLASEDGENWTPLWNSYDEALKLSAEERRQTSLSYDWLSDFKPYYLDIDAYAGKAVKFAFRFVGAGGTAVNIDNVVVGVPYPKAKYAVPDGVFFPALLPDLREAKDPKFLAAPDCEYVWANKSTNGRTFDWTFTDADGNVAMSHDEDLVTPAYTTGTVAAIPTLTTHFGVNKTEPWKVAGTSHLDPNGSESNPATVLFGGEIGEVMATDNGKSLGGVATYNYFDPALAAIGFNRLFEFSGDVDRAWEALLGQPEHTDDFVTGIATILPAPSAPYGIKYAYVTALVMQAAPTTNLHLTLLKWEREEVGSIVSYYAGEEIASAMLTDIKADQENFQGLVFDFSDTPFIIDSPVIAVITGFDRTTDYIRFPYLSAENSEFTGTSLMTFREVDGNGNAYDAFVNLNDVPMGTGSRRCTGALMGFGACFYHLELAGGDNTMEVPAEGGEKTFTVRTDADPADLRLLEGGRPCEYVSFAVAATSAAGEYAVTVKVAANTAAEKRSATLRLGVPGAVTEIALTQEADLSGIDAITADYDAGTEYYDAHGLRVMKPESGNVYMVRRGTEVVKVLLK